MSKKELDKLIEASQQASTTEETTLGENSSRPSETPKEQASMSDETNITEDLGQTDVETLLKKISTDEITEETLVMEDEDALVEEAPIELSRKELIALNKKNKNKKRGVWKWIMTLLLLGLLGFVGFAGWNLYSKTDNAISNAFKPRKNQSAANENINPITDPISILVLGVDDNDERSIGSARTDAMLLLTVSPKTKKITMTSIPRDTYTQINAPNYNGRGKINSAYAHGGIDSTVDAVESLFAEKQFNATTGTEEILNKFPINYYLTLDFNAFESIIDALGGIDVEVKLPETVIEQNAKGKKVVKLENGQQVLNGESALAYARTRKVDNDVMRGSRQQQVLEATISKAMSIGSITKFEKVIDALNGHFWTDMNMSTMKKIAESGLTNRYSFESYIFDWTGFDYNEESMVALHQDSLNYITHKFRLNLGIDEKDPMMDADGFKFSSNGIISQYTFPLDGQGVVN